MKVGRLDDNAEIVRQSKAIMAVMELVYGHPNLPLSVLDRVLNTPILAPGAALLLDNITVQMQTIADLRLRKRIETVCIVDASRQINWAIAERVPSGTAPVSDVYEGLTDLSCDTGDDRVSQALQLFADLRRVNDLREWGMATISIQVDPRILRMAMDAVQQDEYATIAVKDAGVWPDMKSNRRRR